MASYVVISGNPVAGTGDGVVLAVVVTDGVRTEVYGTDLVAQGLREDGEFGTGPEADVLATGLSGLSYYTLSGPHTFDGDTATAGPALARSYGVA